MKFLLFALKRMAHWGDRDDMFSSLSKKNIR